LKVDPDNASAKEALGLAVAPAAHQQQRLRGKPKAAATPKEEIRLISLINK
jgi:hypothetical protein